MAKNKLVGNIASLGIVQIANYAIPMITMPIISRIIGPNNYGIINYMNSFVNYFVLFVTFGFDMSATRVIARNPDDLALRNKVFSQVFLSQILLFGLSTIVFIITILEVGDIKQYCTVAVFTYLTIVGTVFTQNWLFQAMQDLKKIAVFNFLSKVIGNLSVLLLVTRREHYYLQPLVVSITNIIVSLLSFFWAVKKYNITILLYPLKKLFHFIYEEKTIFLNKVAISLYTTTNTFMLGFMVSKTDLGNYSAASTLITIICTIINTPLSLALYPYIGKEFGKGMEQGKEKVKGIIPIVFYVTLFCSIMVFLLGGVAIHMFYGKEYIIAGNIIRIMSLYPFVVALADTFKNQILLNLGYDKIALRISIIGGIISPLLNYFSIKLSGAYGSAVNWVSIEILLCILEYYYIKKLKILKLNIADFSLVRFMSQLKLVMAKK